MSLKAIALVVLYSILFAGLLLAVDLSWFEIRQLRDQVTGSAVTGWVAVPDQTPGGRMKMARIGGDAVRLQGGGFRDWGALLVLPRERLTVYDACPLEVAHAHDAGSGFAEVGIAFEARQDLAKEPIDLTVSVADRYTEPEAGVCTVCGDGFSSKVPVSPEWQRFAIALGQMRQLGWGVPARSRVDLDSLAHVGFRFAPGQEFDVSLRDVRLIRLPEAER
jgi:hypothetical protein